MINVNALKGVFVANGDDIKSACKKMGFSSATIYRKLNKGILDSDEIELIVKTYNIPKDQAVDIFFNFK